MARKTPRRSARTRTKKTTRPRRRKKPAYDPSAEPLTANDYLSVARNCLWVAAGAIGQAAGVRGEDNYDPLLHHVAEDLWWAVKMADEARAAVPGDAPVPVVGVRGLPPSPGVVKLARRILESHRDSGGVSVDLGSSSFILRLGAPSD